MLIFIFPNKMKLYTAKPICTGDFWLVFEPAQLFRSIDKSSWDDSKTSQKSPAQIAFAVVI